VGVGVTGTGSAPVYTPGDGTVAAAALVMMTPPTPGPLWRFALVGLGPLSALGLFALLHASFQHFA